MPASGKTAGSQPTGYCTGTTVLSWHTRYTRHLSQELLAFELYTNMQDNLLHLATRTSTQLSPALMPAHTCPSAEASTSNACAGWVRVSVGGWAKPTQTTRTTRQTLSLSPPNHHCASFILLEGGRDSKLLELASEKVLARKTRATSYVSLSIS